MRKILGPYGDKGGWRVVTIDESGARKSVWYKELREAAEQAEQAREALGLKPGLTCEEAIKKYLEWLKVKGWKRPSKQSSVDTVEYSLRLLLGHRVADRVSRLDKHACTGLYGALCKQVGISVDSHRNALGRAVSFGKWCVKQGHAKANPWTEVEPEGQRKRGKAQLRIDEARKWLEWAQWKAHQGEEGAVMAMLTLLLNLRISEVIGIQVRDVDDRAQLLWVRDSKSAAGKRCLEVPEVLVEHMARLRESRGSGDGVQRLWHYSDKHTVRKWVQRICEEAEVPKVTAHGMRGLHATLATQAGATSHLVAAAMGHASSAVTERHYIAPGVKEQAQAKQVQGRLLDS